MNVEYHAIEFNSAAEAIQYCETPEDCVAILLDGPKVVTRAEADRLAAAGVEFAYLCDHLMPDGTHRIVTVPVN